VVCISNAVALTNPEVGEAKRRKIPVIPPAEMLHELMRLKTACACRDPTANHDHIHGRPDS